MGSYGDSSVHKSLATTEVTEGESAAEPRGRGSWEGVFGEGVLAGETLGSGGGGLSQMIGGRRRSSFVASLPLDPVLTQPLSHKHPHSSLLPACPGIFVAIFWSENFIFPKIIMSSKYGTHDNLKGHIIKKKL